MFTLNNNRQRRARRIALGLLLVFGFELVLPTAAIALTAGPSAPEFSSFEPVGTTDLVNVSSGDFVYNLPILTVPGSKGGGYPLSLSYHSGQNAESEASWVGFGWTLNPGAINRSLSGLPDDYNDAPVLYMNKTWPVWSQVRTNAASLEVFSTEKQSPKQKLKIDEKWAGSSFGLKSVNRYSNFKGFSVKKGLSASWRGQAKISLAKSEKGLTVDGSISARKIYKKFKEKHKQRQEDEKKDSDSKKSKKKKKQKKEKEDSKLKKFLKKVAATNTGKQTMDNMKFGYKPSFYSMATGVDGLMPAPNDQTLGYSLNRTMKTGLNTPYVPIGPRYGYDRMYSVEFGEGLVQYDAYGMLHHQDFAQEESNYKVGDFNIENDKPLDLYSPTAPFARKTPDQFMLTGEGLGGTIQFYRPDNGIHGPVDRTSEHRNRHLGIDLIVYNPISIGLDIGLIPSSSYTSKTDWCGEQQVDAEYTNDAGAFAAFRGDLAGQRWMSRGTQMRTARLDDWLTCTDLIWETEDEITPEILAQFDQRSSHIETISIGDQDQGFNQNVAIDQLDDHIDAGYDESIAEFQILNKGGNKYIYGLPVYNRLETNLTIDGKHDKQSGKIVYDSDLVDAYDATTTHESNALCQEVYMGTQQIEPYSGTFLLTHIVGDGYVDADGLAGPSDGDFGGWTRFDYKQSYGKAAENGEWYRWRSPYFGLSQSTGKLTTIYDDYASCSYGEKEVYYLDAIETESHVAFFVKNTSESNDFGAYFDGLTVPTILQGSGETRKDGLGAMGAVHQPAQGPSGEQLTSIDPDDRTDDYQPLSYLERIVLISKSDIDASVDGTDIRPVSVTNFEYDYSLARKTLNNMEAIHGDDPTPEQYAQSGKLTLKRVWTDYGGVYEAEISPYTFHYEYFQHTPNQAYPQAIEDLFGRVGEETEQYAYYEQNPDYKPGNVDAWGNHGYDVKDRKAYKRPGLDQSHNPDYDPAAWQLKRVGLPSGGEIHIQYEADDYAFVQDKSACVMTSILENGTDESMRNFRINLADIGLVADAYTPEEYERVFQEQLALIKQVYPKDAKMFFRFLYSLDSNVPVADWELNGRTEFVTGYSSVESISGDWNGGNPYIEVTFKGGDNDPRQAAYFQFLEKNVEPEGGGGVNFRHAPEPVEMHQISETLALMPSLLDVNGDLSQDHSDVYRYLRGAEGTPTCTPPSGDRRLTPAGGLIWAGVRTELPDESDFGSINCEHSYLRIPVWKRKKGGGIRVKRIMTYSPGLESDNSDARLYGTEYTYELEDGRSSGVTPWEPDGIREENPFIQVLPRFKQNFLNKAARGKDKEKVEGPVTESLYPSPNVIYSRVLAQSLSNVTNDGASITNTGHHEYCFYTAKDYPVKVDFTDLKPRGDRDHLRRRRLALPLGPINVVLASVEVSQGYRIERNGMHGVMRSERSWSGPIDGGGHLVSGTDFDYFEPGEQVPVAYREGDLVMGCLKPKGTEVDVALYRAQHRDLAQDLYLGVDIHLAFPPGLPPTFSAWVSYSLQRTRLRQFSACKVIDHTPILKGTRSFQEGLLTENTNVLFDDVSGDPLVTTSADVYDGALFGPLGGQVEANGRVYQVSIPAHWNHESMGPKSASDGNRNLLTTMAGTIVSRGNDGNPLPDEGLSPTPVDLTWFSDPGGVLTANAVIFENGNYDLSNLMQQQITELLTANPEALAALNERWLPKDTYTYLDEKSNSNDYFGSVTHSGTLTEFVSFDPDNPGQGNWESTEFVDAYDEHGIAINSHYELIENGSPSEIHKSVRFGYDNQHVVMSAANARSSAIYSNDFEALEDASIVEDVAHTGRSSKKLVGNNGSSLSLNDALLLDDQVLANGLLMQFWIYRANQEVLDEAEVKVNGINTSTQFETPVRVAKVGGWEQYEIELENWGGYGLAAGDPVSISLQYNGVTDAYVDDVRIRPINSSVETYVYDRKDLRLLARLDDRNFATMYQYNAEGQLMRKVIETERGIQTFQEQQHNTPTVNRYE